MIRKFIGLAALLMAGTVAAGDIGRIESRVEGNASLYPNAGAVYVEFVGSPSITDALRRDLAGHGFAVAWNKSDAKQLLTLRGRVSIKSSNGKTVQEDLSAIAEGPRLALSVPVKEKPAPAEIPEGHFSTEKPDQVPPQAGLSVAGGNPVPVDLGDQGRGFTKRMLEKGIGNDPSCPPEKCRVAQIVSQQTTIDIEVVKNGKPERARAIASMQGKDVNVDMLTARAMFLAMGMVRGGR